jgi:hypothetical protein
MNDVAYVTQKMWDQAQIDLRHARELLSNAEPSTDMDNDMCSDWVDARDEWLEAVVTYDGLRTSDSVTDSPRL